ncbi:alpha-hydroxy acid oxidase [Paracoccus albus]|uniref:alpha-hydroxy acid oxidase n=1 Tax=Paracoccus albus TaxID=3017784 RepID=UPI0022F1381F|nr:alpha-hydroxy acid oxidase [Paracoccus albus]WBU61266.1 alpha-hydroxy acid oxidase [Paracoccus albus]
MSRLERRYVNVEDFARAARRRLPRIFADYIDGGAFSETTMHRNSADFERIALRQRVLRPLGTPDLSVAVGESRYALPCGPGPVGFQGLYRRDGDIAIAQGAAAAGVPFVLSTFSINGLEAIANAAGKVPDFQLYLDRDPDINAARLELCRAVGVRRIFLTVDTAITSIRERDVRNGFRSVDRLTPGLIWQFARKPGWSLNILRRGMPQVDIVRDDAQFGKGALAQATQLSSRLEKNLTWNLVSDLRQQWAGELIVKGISDPEDARRAIECGAEGVVLSNHGGRQLDHGTSTVSRIAEIRDALGSGPILYVDSGFRRGSDIVKALALGADFVLLGRPFAWAVAAEGQSGVDRLFQLLRQEVQITLQLMGLSTVEELQTGGRKNLII